MELESIEQFMYQGLLLRDSEPEFCEKTSREFHRK